MKGIRIDVWCLLVLLSIFSRRTGVDSAPALLTPREQYPFVAGLDEQLISKVGGLDSLTCDACKFIVGKLQDLMAKGATEDIIAGAAKDLCRLFKIEDKTVCEEGVDVFKVEVLTVVDRVALSPDEACGILLGDKCSQEYDPWKQQWNILIPGGKPPVKPIPFPKPGSPTTRILQLTDFHYDPAYTPGLTNDCNEPLCCRVPNAKGSGSTAAGYWGDYNCDVPYQTIENLMQHLQSIEDKFDWVYWTGDLPAHNVWNNSREQELIVLHTLVNLTKHYLPDKVVFPAIGNHESVPVNSFPPPFITGSIGNQWLLDALADSWGVWLSRFPEWPEMIKTIKLGGFYNVKIQDKLRVISLQTNYCNNENYWLLINSTDPANQLTWLVEQLTEAEMNEEKVHIIGHITSGLNDTCLKAWSWNYHRIISRFENTIMGQFFGHTHTDQFKVFFDDQNRTRATSVAYMAPSVTGYKNQNFGFRIYTVDGAYEGTTSAVLDHDNYYMNVSDANLTNKPKWLPEYSAKEAYNMTGLRPSDWANLIETFKKETDNTGYFGKYYRYYSKMYSTTECTGACKAHQICFMETGRSYDPSQCATSLPEGVTMDDLRLYEQQKTAHC